MEFVKTFSRNEMKHIVAGGGNIKCRTGTAEWYCDGGNLEECTDICADIGSCEGCTQFPEMD